MTQSAILPAEQRALLPHLAGLQALGYTLYGGTAVALQLGHRESVDFDFFTDRPFDEEAIRGVSPVLARATVTQTAPRTLTLLAQAAPGALGVKISFFAGLSFGRVGEPRTLAGGELRLAALEDLLGHKLKVLLQRVEAKDYQDIAALLRHGLNLEHGLGAAMALVDHFSVAEAVRALAYFEGGDLARLSTADRRLLSRAAREVGPIEPVPIVSRSLS